MKILSMLFLASIFVGVNAQAEVKMPGTVVLNRCSEDIEVSGDSRDAKIPGLICLASVTGLPNDYVIVDSDVWQIMQEEQTFEMQLVGVVGEHGLLQYNTNTAMVIGYGRITYNDLTIKIKSQIFKAKNFKIMLHTM